MNALALCGTGGEIGKETTTVKANYKPLTRSEAKKIAREEVNSAYQKLFAECAADVMQQVMSNVLLCLERDYDFSGDQLKEFIHNQHNWIEAMQEPTPFSRTWSTEDNIDYFKSKYGIDLGKEFTAEVVYK